MVIHHIPPVKRNARVRRYEDATKLMWLVSAGPGSLGE
jgi:hypothetical protein